MNHQKSSIPYLLLLGFILIGLPILDIQVQREHKLKIEIVPEEASSIYVKSSNEMLVSPVLTVVYK